MKKFLLPALAIILSSFTTSAATIPVVFHVLYNNANQNVSDSIVYDQLRVLNQDFNRLNADTINTPAPFLAVAASANIDFCLAQQDPLGNASTGIIRKQVSVPSFSTISNIVSSATGGDDMWPRDYYLNIYIVSLANGMLGLSSLPGASANGDGVIIHYTIVGGPTFPGSQIGYNRGRTLVSLVAHWFNLRSMAGSLGCADEDSVSDTPISDGSLFGGCLTFPHVTCGNGPNGEMFMNFMTYADDDCKNLFTQGQCDRMNTALNTQRSSLLSSIGCNLPNAVYALEEQAFDVFPNPTSNGIQIFFNAKSTAVEKITLHDALGRTIESMRIHGEPAYIFTTEKLAPGIYILEFSGNGVRFNKKVVVE